MRFAPVTAGGRGAVATVIVQGSNALRGVSELFRPFSGGKLATQPFGKIVYGHWTLDGQRGEDLVVVPKDAERIEIHCHGGDVAIQMIANELRKIGAIQCSPAEMANSIYANEYEADFQWTLSRALTQQTARLVLAQRLIQKKFFQTLSAALTNQNQPEADRLLKRCLRWEVFGRKLTQPWKVTLCGKPNVGKSSLINSIVGFQRAIVHSTAGTTRDVVAEFTAIEGWPVQIFDTAGIRESTDSIEVMGIDRARKSMDDADLVVLVVDISDTTQREIERQIEEFRPDMVVANKMDLNHTDFNSVDVAVSAKTDSGIQEFLKLLVAKMMPERPNAEEAVPVSDLQLELLGKLLSPAENVDAVSLIRQI